ncbi:CCA tRNA nucleotidyltransferase [Methylobacterium sp. BTF04]|uniref:CCA tRNA nucleotidyltransferase n=1 Tax=Methylobacterium sp. BTF04 TaxID=2708300 RepID=UPI0013D802AD|nr:CCA tRNA nucleotidyltransferase [Methylobacterium sp. BTF04]NEU12407.1 CCA tRNA nucleotidyltransferase [Methylobacterium sp. BTF04]
MSVRSLDRDAPGRLLAEPGVAIVLAALAMDGEETRLVGGCVRDALLGTPISDIDLATTLPPATIIARVKAAGLRSIPTGIEHGTVTVLAADTTFEVTTLREDIETDGRHAVVRFGRDFTLDAARRDFTINAMSVGGDGRLNDTTDGFADLAAARVRFIGDAPTRIREDALRILRFFRFHARYGIGEPDRDGLAACIAARDTLDGLSRERVRAEFLNLLLAPGALAAVTTLSETGLLLRLIGGVGDVERLRRASARREDALPIAPNSRTDAIDRLAALAVFSTDDADRLRIGLRLSKAEHVRLSDYAPAIAALHDISSIDSPCMRRLAAIHGVPSLALALRVTHGEPHPRVDAAALEILGRMVLGEVAPPVMPLAGADLVARGVPPGPQIGRRLALARALWLEKGCPEGSAARDALIERALAEP